MRKFIAGVLLLFLAFESRAKALPDDWVTVGQSELKIYWFSVYSAVLRTPDGRYSKGDMPLLLTLNYHRDIRRQVLLDETEKELRRFLTTNQVADLLVQINDIWPDVYEGDQLSFLLDSQGEGYFFFNGQFMGILHKTYQSQAFVKIWLSKQSRYPTLAKKLRGEFDEDLSD